MASEKYNNFESYIYYWMLEMRKPMFIDEGFPFISFIRKRETAERGEKQNIFLFIIAVCCSRLYVFCFPEGKNFIELEAAFIYIL